MIRTAQFMNNPNFDESERQFDKAILSTEHRIDLLTEVLTWRINGIRSARVSGWLGGYDGCLQ